MATLGQSAFISRQEKFESTNIDAAKKFYEKRGTENGAKDSPAETTKTPDATETEIVKKIDETIRLTKQDLNQHFVRFKERLLPVGDKEWQADAVIDRIETMPKHAKTSLNDALKTFKNDSALLGKRWTDAKQEHHKFREANGLVRSAEYAPMSKIAIWFGIVIGFEAMLNATLLFGLMGFLEAVGQTSLITAVNVLFGASLMGVFLRYKNHNSFMKRLMTVFCIPVFLMVLVFNFGVGHYRDALVQAKNDAEQALSGSVWGEDNPEVQQGAAVDFTQKAMDSIVESVWGIESIMSALLIIVGIGFFGLASYKWYWMNDTYPGYRERDEALRKAHDEYINLIEYARDEFHERREELVERTIDEINRNTNVRKQHIELVSRAQVIRKSYIEWSDSLNTKLTELILAYREGNRMARSTPAPEYFDKPIEISDEAREPPVFDRGELEEDEGLMKAAQDARKSIMQVAEDVEEQFEKLVDASQVDSVI